MCWCSCRARARSAACSRSCRAARCRAGTQVLPLYGELRPEEQDAALAPAAAGSRKVVLATNIAETSLTIEGIRIVVDSGLERRAVFDPVTGMGRLDTARISRASADQRQGRAGRLEPGVCYRAWSEGAQRSLAAFSTPEILQTDLPRSGARTRGVGRDRCGDAGVAGSAARRHARQRARSAAAAGRTG